MDTMSNLAKQETAFVIRAPLAGLLSWLLPGLGHVYLGHRLRGIILMVTIVLTYWTGVAVGGLKYTVDPQHRRLWFMAQMCTGGNTLIAYALRPEPVEAFGLKAASKQEPAPHVAAAEVGIHYTGVAGLLTLLVILDAISRADPHAGRSSSGVRADSGVP